MFKFEFLILSARRTIIDYDKKYWSRKDRPDDWDITIGSKDSAEITDLVGAYLLYKLGLEFLGISGGGLYRDDILMTVVNCSNVGIERLNSLLFCFIIAFSYLIWFM